MADEVKRIEVDISAAAAMLQASPELCEAMNGLVGGPALIEAQKEVERLHLALQNIEIKIAAAGPGDDRWKLISEIEEIVDAALGGNARKD